MGRGINHQHLDTHVSPGEDFYQFVNGGWMRTVEIPQDRSSWGSFHELSKDTDHQVLGLLEQELVTQGAAENKAARLFETGMDLAGIEHHKVSALDPVVAKIRTLTSVEQLPALLGFLSTKSVGAFLQFSVHPDLGNSHMYAAYVEAANLGLPEREYYSDSDEKAIYIRDKYRQYIAAILVTGAGYTNVTAEHAADAILSMEAELAHHMMPKEDRRQIDKLYNPCTAEQLHDLMPSWSWEDYFTAMQLDIPGRTITTDMAFCRFFDQYIPQIPIENIRHYLLFVLMHRAAPYAHAALEDLQFDMYSRTIDGIEIMRPRQERLVKVINHALGEALGQLYVSRYFPPRAKIAALEMVGDIVQAFHHRIAQLPWMSPETKAYALEKLAAFKVKIGYPDTWKDYSTLKIMSVESGGHYLQNMLAFSEWKWEKDKERIGQAVDKDEWFMAPQVVNAYYNPMFNEIVFPAAILHPPFFDWEADAAVNYGGIGAVIGHEITHGFDDQGSRFDKQGNVNEWWTKEDRERFQTLTRKLIDQFDAYHPFEDLPLNGTFTLGENIADLGGLSVAHDALQLYYQRHGHPELVDGFTADQRFFMSWATVWRTKIRPEALRNQIKTDPHPPGLYRAVAAPSNMDSFYQAFDINGTSRWYRPAAERIKIW